jgi:hypothetical protein
MTTRCCSVSQLSRVSSSSRGRTDVTSSCYFCLPPYRFDYLTIFTWTGIALVRRCWNRTTFSFSTITYLIIAVWVSWPTRIIIFFVRRSLSRIETVHNNVDIRRVGQVHGKPNSRPFRIRKHHRAHPSIRSLRRTSHRFVYMPSTN